MFGYVTVNRPEMKVKELELYRSYYCGLCHALHERYGRRGQMLLSYDGTFLAILLTGLYEPEETERRARCLVHPGIEHREKTNRYIEYAADMNVMLAYRKALDDWRDERKQKAKLIAMLLHSDYCRLRARYPRQEKALRKNIRALHEMEAQDRAQAAASDRAGTEKDAGTAAGNRAEVAAGTGKAARCRAEAEKAAGANEAGCAGRDEMHYSEKLSEVLARIDRAAGYTGNFLAQMCVANRDQWEYDLRSTGFYLGKFIYLMDAYDDLEADEKSGSFNVLSELRKLDEAHFDRILKEILLDTAACCCRSFERLPIVRDVELLRNILYSGIWVTFHQIQSGEKETKKLPAWCMDA